MKIPITRPYFPEEDIIAIQSGMAEILKTGRFIKGHFLAQFEEEFASIIGVKYAIAVSSGTAGLEIIYRFFDVADKEVITPTNTFIATSNAVLFAGGKPVLADMHPQTLCLDPSDIKKRITQSTRGIVLVHVAGYISPHIEDIRALCRKHNLFFVEDASHAHGASRSGVMAGAWGDAAVFSCLATKIMTTGGVGGVITTNNDDLAFVARSLRFHGEDSTRGIQDRIGNNWYLSEPQALIGYVQTKRLPEIVRKRMTVARRYDEAFRKLPRVKVFLSDGQEKNGYYKYPLLLLPPLRRADVVRSLEQVGIATGGCYLPPCHLQPVYQKMFGFVRGDFPIAEDILERTVTLPIFAGMINEEVDYVIQHVQAACGPVGRE